MTHDTVSSNGLIGNNPIKNPHILVTRKLLPNVEERMSQLFKAQFNHDDHAMSHDEIIAGSAGKHVLVPTVTDNIDENLINALPDSIKMIANFQGLTLSEKSRLPYWWWRAVSGYLVWMLLLASAMPNGRACRSPIRKPTTGPPPRPTSRTRPTSRACRRRRA